MDIEYNHEEEMKMAEKEYDFLKVLGRGSFGKVMLMRKKSNSKLYAVKIIKKLTMASFEKIEKLKTEKKILSKISHPFVINMDFCFQSVFRVFFVMEFLGGGELFVHMQQ